jgi:hypothetical protein
MGRGAQAPSKKLWWFLTHPGSDLVTILRAFGKPFGEI